MQAVAQAVWSEAAQEYFFRRQRQYKMCSNTLLDIFDGAKLPTKQMVLV